MIKYDMSNDILVTAVAATLVLLTLLCFIIFFLFAYKNRQIRSLLEIQELKDKYQKEIIVAQLEIREQTLKNMSEEIHDNISQILSLAILNLRAIDDIGDAPAAGKLAAGVALVKKSILELRFLSKTMDHDNIEQAGLTGMITFELQMLERTGKFKTVILINGMIQRLTNEHELILYRIVQEALNNVIKHSGAKNIGITVNYAGDELTVIIADDGKGFDTEGVNPVDVTSSGTGLKNIRNRAKLIGGTADIYSAFRKGTTVTVRVPLF